MKGHELSATERAEMEMADAKRSKPSEDSRPAPCSRCNETKEEAMRLYETFKQDTARMSARIGTLERAIRLCVRHRGHVAGEVAIDKLADLLPENATVEPCRDSRNESNKGR